MDTDEIARQLVSSGQPALAEIRDCFGATVIAPDGSLLRDRLAKIVFADIKARHQLEAILHPRIRAAWLAQVETWRAAPMPSDGGRRENRAVAFVVIPLLFETAAEDQFDKIICVACSPAAQQERLAARGWSDEQSRQRIAAQWPVEQKIARAHFVLWTEGKLTAHAQQAARILERI